jgi:hypothetical protein
MTVLAPEVAGSHTIRSGVRYVGKSLGITGVPDRNLLCDSWEGGLLSVCKSARNLERFSMSMYVIH